MATTPETATTEQYGVETTQAGVTVESETITETPAVETVPDQKNAVVDEITYDTRTDLKLTYRGTKLTAANGVVTWGGKKWAVDSHEEAGTYNGLRRYSLSAHRFVNYPKAS